MNRIRICWRDPFGDAHIDERAVPPRGLALRPPGELRRAPATWRVVPTSAGLALRGEPGERLLPVAELTVASWTLTVQATDRAVVPPVPLEQRLRGAVLGGLPFAMALAGWAVVQAFPPPEPPKPMEAEERLVQVFVELERVHKEPPAEAAPEPAAEGASDEPEADAAPDTSPATQATSEPASSDRRTRRSDLQRRDIAQREHGGSHHDTIGPSQRDHRSAALVTVGGPGRAVWGGGDAGGAIDGVSAGGGRSHRGTLGAGRPGRSPGGFVGGSGPPSGTRDGTGAGAGRRDRVVREAPKKAAPKGSLDARQLQDRRRLCNRVDRTATLRASVRGQSVHLRPAALRRLCSLPDATAEAPARGVTWTDLWLALGRR